METIAYLALAILLVAILAVISTAFFPGAPPRQREEEEDDVQASTPDDDETQFDDHEAAVTDSVAVIGVDTTQIYREPVAVAFKPPSFAIAHAPVAVIEGGYQRHAADRGNYNRLGHLVGTNWGIAAPVAEKYFKRMVTTADMKKLAKSVAHDIFQRDFWEPMQGYAFPSQALANIVYDGHVNHGTWGLKLLQRVVGVYEDGVIGPETMTALMARDPQQVYNDYYVARLKFYWAIVRNRPTQLAFWNGWMKRLESYLPDYTGPAYKRPDPRKPIA